MFQYLSDIVVGASALIDVRYGVDCPANVQSAVECVLVPMVQETGHGIVEGIDVLGCDVQQLLVVRAIRPVAVVEPLVVGDLGQQVHGFQYFEALQRLLGAGSGDDISFGLCQSPEAHLYASVQLGYRYQVRPRPDVQCNGCPGLLVLRG